MASVTVDQIDWSHPSQSRAVSSESLVHGKIRCSLSSTGNRSSNFSMWGNHLAYAAAQGMKSSRDFSANMLIGSNKFKIAVGAKRAYREGVMPIENFHNMRSSDNENNCSLYEDFNTQFTSTTTDSSITEGIEGAPSALQASDKIQLGTHSTLSGPNSTLLAASVTSGLTTGNRWRLTQTSHPSKGRHYTPGGRKYIVPILAFFVIKQCIGFYPGFTYCIFNTCGLGGSEFSPRLPLYVL